MRLHAIALACLIASASMPSEAASVRQTSVGEMLAMCELVFEGRAVETGAELTEDGEIFTWVDFVVIDVVKGGPVASPLRLHFMGGIVGERGMDVGGMRVPEVGERGIYFVESLQRRQVHPLFGWDQGRLRLFQALDGSLRVTNANGEPVVGLSGPNAVRSNEVEFSHGTARELNVDPDASLDDALGATALKARLRARLGGGAQR